MSEDMDYDPLDARVEYVGPFSDGSYIATIGGYSIPYTKLMKMKDGWWVYLTRDGCASTGAGPFIESDMSQSLWLLARGMAMAAGYTSFGGGAVEANPFKSRLIGLGLDDFDAINEHKDN